MYARRLTLPGRSFLLLGPSGTGKTTWLRAQLPRAHWYNLLLDRELLRLMREPGSFRREVEGEIREKLADGGVIGVEVAVEEDDLHRSLQYAVCSAAN